MQKVDLNKIYQHRKDISGPKVLVQLPVDAHTLAKTRAASQKTTLVQWLTDAVRHYAQSAKGSAL